MQAGLALLTDHVARFNAGVRSGDFGPMVDGFTEDAEKPDLDREALEVAEPQPWPVPVLVPDLYLRQVPPDAGILPGSKRGIRRGCRQQIVERDHVPPPAVPQRIEVVEQLDEGQLPIRAQEGRVVLEAVVVDVLKSSTTSREW